MSQVILLHFYGFVIELKYLADANYVHLGHIYPLRALCQYYVNATAYKGNLYSIVM